MCCQQQSTAVRKQKAPAVWGIIEDTGYKSLAWKNSIRGNAEL